MPLEVQQRIIYLHLPPLLSHQPFAFIIHPLFVYVLFFFSSYLTASYSTISVQYIDDPSFALVQTAQPKLFFSKINF